MITDNLLEKLKKLSAKQKSAEAIGSIHEAETFAVYISKVLTKYKIDMSAVEFHEFEKIEPVEQEKVNLQELGLKPTAKRIAWQENLAMQIARANYCRILVQSKSNNVWFVGRKTDRQVCSYLYGYLVRVLTREMNRQYTNAVQQDESVDGFRKSFLDGALESLRVRLQVPRKEAEELARLNGNSHALVVITSSDKAVADYMHEYHNRGKARGIGSTSSRRGTSNGYMRGRTYGKSVSLNRASGTLGNAQKKLTN